MQVATTVASGRRRRGLVAMLEDDLGSYEGDEPEEVMLAVLTTEIRLSLSLADSERKCSAEKKMRKMASDVLPRLLGFAARA